MVEEYTEQKFTYIYKICHCRLQPINTRRPAQKGIILRKKYTIIKAQKFRTLLHRKIPLLFKNNEARVKKEDSKDFDITIGSFHGAEMCELVGLCIC